MTNNTSLPRKGTCGCRRGMERDNCPQCEGSGIAIDWGAYHRMKRASHINASRTHEGGESILDAIQKLGEAVKELQATLPKGNPSEKHSS